ncbi:MAG: hypothetical protein CBB68_06460 [Rhodospirillaceae bacterium TMED8]|nr:MarR family transcriptional regulator [Magnetovibrio sp.]OUT51258.1 MAG: hypothetical protein CBB68_06460 [Rhodospirillaceae bacterium TMED8]
MSGKQKTLNSEDGLEPSIKLGMLAAVEQSSDVTQRKLAQELGIALGLTNAYLKRLVKKGYIKALHAPANRYLYYLTPKGFTEKSSLTAEYLSQSFKFFRDARQQCSDAFTICTSKNWHNIVLCGAGDLTDIAILSAQEFNVKIVGVVDPNFTGSSLLDIPALKSFKSLIEFEAAIVTDTRQPQKTFNYASRYMPKKNIIALPLLGLNTNISTQAEWYKR